MPLNDNSIDSCRKACEDGSPFCLRLQASSQQFSGLLALQQIAIKNPPLIKAVDLRDLFSIASDPCDRGDTTFLNGMMSNKGGACDLTVGLPLATVTIHVPELLQAQWSASHGKIELRFADQQTGAKLEFSDDNLNADFGGQISGVFSDGDDIGFSVGTNSCVRARMK